MSQKYQFITAHASEHPVTLLCRVLGLARSGYYAWRQSSLSAREQHDQHLTGQIQTIFTDSRRIYESSRVHASLKAHGIHCARKRVARLMRQAQLCARRRSIRTTDSRHTEPSAPNLLARTFEAEAPNQVWVAAITYLPTRECWLYLAVVLDLFARRVVGWSMQPSLECGLVLTALSHALQRRQLQPGLLHHSDRGSQYASAEYQALLRQTQMCSSMSRKGNCWDNVAMESFFATLKAELSVSLFDSHAAARGAADLYTGSQVYRAAPGGERAAFQLLAPEERHALAAYLECVYAEQPDGLTIDLTADDCDAEVEVAPLGRNVVDYVFRPWFEGPFFTPLNQISAAMLRAWLKAYAGATFYQLAGGMDTPWLRLAERMEVRTGAPVHAAHMHSGGVDLELPAGACSYDGVVLACPAIAATQILGEHIADMRHLRSCSQHADLPHAQSALVCDDRWVDPTVLRCGGQ